MAVAMIATTEHHARPHLAIVPAPEPFARRRLVALALMLMVVVGGVVMATRVAAVLPALPAADSGTTVSGNGIVSPQDVLVGGQLYVVQPGDSLWRIASRLSPVATAELVDRMVNDLGGARLDVGQRIVLPVP